ncbi:hypothetical protein CRUP_007827, partial [Coryphaenoides rupestris]
MLGPEGPSGSVRDERFFRGRGARRSRRREASGSASPGLRWGCWDRKGRSLVGLRGRGAERSGSSGPSEVEVEVQMDDVASVCGFWRAGGVARGGSGVKGRTAAAGVLSCLWGRGRNLLSLGDRGPRLRAAGLEVGTHSRYPGGTTGLGPLAVQPLDQWTDVHQSVGLHIRTSLQQKRVCLQDGTGGISLLSRAAFFFQSRWRSSATRLSMELTSTLRRVRVSRCCCSREPFSWFSLLRTCRDQGTKLKLSHNLEHWKDGPRSVVKGVGKQPL